MKTKLRMLAAGVSAAVMLGLSSQAAATVHAGSSLAISNLQIAIGQFDGQTIVPGGATVESFNFNLTNTATLGSVVEATGATCFKGGVGITACGASPTLDALEADLGSINRVNNATGADGTLLWYALDGGDWANSDSVIKQAQLVNGVPTATDQIAQSNITNIGNAASNSEIKSTTGFTFTFAVTNTGELSLSFLADPDMIAQILGEPDALALANMNVSFTLQQNTGGSAFVRWAPEGTAANDCIAVSGATCVETADSEDLNLNVTTSANNTSATHSYDPNVAGLQRYGIFVTGLTAGTWTLGLNAVTSTLITRVPEPGILSLMGLGLLGIGASQRRRTKTA